MRASRPFWRRWLLPAFLTLLCLDLLLFVSWTLPRSRRERNAAARAERARLELAAERRTVDLLRERARSIAANGSDRERFYAARVGGESAELLATVEAVEAMARAPGLRVGARAMQHELVAATALDRVRFTLPLEGSYPQLVGFLREVETSPRFITVDRIEMHAVEQRGATLQVQLSAYLKAAPGAAPKRGVRAR